MGNNLLYNPDSTKTKVESEPWVLCKGFEVIYYLGGELNSEPNVLLLPDFSNLKQLSNHRAKHFADEFDEVGKLLASLSTQAAIDSNDALVDSYFNPVKEWVYATSYLTEKYICVSSDNRTWTLPKNAMKLFKPADRKKLKDCYSFSDKFYIPLLDSLHDPSL
jgi:hypothetical protein